MKRSIGCLLACTCLAAAAHAATVVRTEPANGSKGVSPDVGVIRLHFDARVTAAFGFTRSAQGEFPPLADTGAVAWASATCLEVKLKPLKPNTAYALVLKPKEGEPTTIQFETGAAGAPEPVVTIVPPAPPTPPVPAEPSVVGTWDIAPIGWNWEFKADGTFHLKVRSDGGVQERDGSYTLKDNTLRWSFQGDPDPIVFRCAWQDANTVTLSDDKGAAHRMVRSGGVRPPVPEPAAPSIVGVWESGKDKTHWDFKADGSITYSRPEENYRLGMPGKYTLEGDRLTLTYEGADPIRTTVSFVDASTFQMGAGRSATRYRRIGGGPTPAPAGPVARLTPAAGWRFQVTRTLLVDLTLKAADGSAAPLQYLKQTLIFVEEVKQVDGGQVAEVTRKITKAEVEAKGYGEQAVQKQQIAAPGTVLRVSLGRRGSVAVDGTGEAVDEDFGEAVGGPLAPDLWPQGDLKPGQRWSYEGADLVRRMPFECNGGRIDLQVESVAADPASGLVTARIRGTLQTKVQPAEVPLDLNAKVSIDLPVAIGVPLLARFDGTLSAQTTLTDDQGRQHAVTCTGKGAFEQLAAPAMAIVRAAGGSQPTPAP